MPFIRSGDVQLWYETFGDGEPLVLIMGLGGVIQAWALQIAEFAKHYRLICMDNRGAGRSDKPEGPYSITAFAEDLAAVLDAAEVESAHVLGVSMGGLIAQEFYHLAPRRVRSLILGCTGVGPNDPAAVPPEPDVIAALRLDRRSEPLEKVTEAMMHAFYHPTYISAIPNLAARLVKINRDIPQPPHAFEAQLQACYSHRPNSPRLKDIRVPTLVLHGEHDRVWPLANAEYLAAHIPNAELVVIPEAGHMFMLEKPREFNRAVLDFLGRIA
mgnify:CR=1 FL=1